MINNIQAKNFKSWKDTGLLDIAPLTGFFGTNSTGKSSIFQMLLVLKQTKESPDRKIALNTGDDNSAVNLGTFFDIIFSHKTDIPIELKISWNLPDPMKIYDPEIENQILFKIDNLTFNTKIKQDGGRPITEEFIYEFSDQNTNYKFGMRTHKEKEKKGKYDLISSPYREKRIVGRPWPLPPPVKCYGFPDEAIGFYQNTGFLPTFVLAFEELFSRIAYLGPLRDYPKTSYLWAGDTPVDVGRKGENAISALLSIKSNRISLGKWRKKQTIVERIAHWLKEMGMIHDFKLEPIAPNRKDYEVRITKTVNGPEVLITNVGTGVSQILPVLVLCYYMPEKSIILLEHPEIHLHPSAQAILADVLIEVVKERNVQIIFESHSEHLLRRLQRRIAENDISKDRTAFYFCKMENASSKIEKLVLDDNGNISNWPDGFFGDEIGELNAMVQAIQKREIEENKN